MQEKRIAPQLIKTINVDRENYQIKFIMSTGEIDRHGEVIDQKGWKLDKFSQNPVVLWGHNQNIFSVGKVVSMEMVNGNLEGVVQFAYNENPDAKTLFELYAGGYMSAVSVGFMNLKWMYDEQNDLLTLLENELFELSLVNVPANASALAKAKAKGFDQKVIDQLGKEVKAIDEDERFKNLGEQIPFVRKDVGDDIKGEEVTEKKEDEVTDVAPVVEQEPTDEEVKSALTILFKCKRDTIKASVKELSSRLNDASEDNNKEQVGTAPSNEASQKKGLIMNKDINSLIRSLLGSKSKPTA